ncbi:MAG: Gfo/Idh/MocA family oxidoreductase [Hyphomonadaceae bacterium]|nr:Gfo/Idh/MocA family oxidoreductase [Hyphomonadaceae bacterium]
MGRLRMAMVGGGPGAFIGPVHRRAAELDAAIELVAGAFTSDPKRAPDAAAFYGVDPARSYAAFQDMLDAEKKRPDGAEFVCIVTPNHLHWPVAKAALEAGFDVMSDKPATATAEEAHALQRLLAGMPKRLYGLTYTYTGYPLVREARTLCISGALGVIRKVVVEYSQGWLSTRAELENKQAAWRTDPARAGAGCTGDIGVHAFNLAEFVAGERVSSLCADVSTVVDGRALDDDCNVLIRFANGARGVLHASQIALGERNNLNLRIYGDEGALAWRQETPNELALTWADGRGETRHAGAGHLKTSGEGYTRLPTGHPEGYFEAFANLYRDFACARREGRTIETTLVPGIAEGVRGMEFVELAVTQSRKGWVEFRGGKQ